MTEAFPQIHPVYRQNLARFANLPAPDEPREVPGRVLVRSVEAAMELLCAVDTLTHRIEQVSYRASDPLHGAVLTALTTTMIRRTVQDVAEHAALRLENLLRGAGGAPVAGIVQPENADPIFRSVRQLTRALFSDYRRLTGYKPGPNDDDAVPSAAWLESHPELRIQRILEAVPEVCLETGIRKTDIRIVGADQGTRVTLSIAGPPDPRLHQRYVLRLESVIKSRVDPRLELYLEEARDKNAKRRPQLESRQEEKP